MALKKCSKCGKEFTCGNEKPGCWCEGLFLDIETLNELKEKYDNCLCPTCLEAYSNKQVKK